MKRRRGFTLIELMVLLAVLTVIIQITAPAVARFFRGRKRIEDARRIMALTRLARNEAIARGEPMRFWVDMDEGFYGLETQSSYMRVEDDVAFIQREYKMSDEVTLTADGTVFDEDGRMIVVFRPDGTCDGGELQTITLTDRDAKEIRINRIDEGARFVIEVEDDEETWVDDQAEYIETESTQGSRSLFR